MENRHAVVLRHAQLVTPVGCSPTEVSKAVHEGKPGFRISTDTPVARLDGTEGAFPLLGQIGEPGGQSTLSPARLLFKLNNLLDTVDIHPQPVTALLCRPAEHDPQYTELEKQLLPLARKRLHEYGISQLEEVDSKGIAGALAAHCQRMQQGQQPSLLVLAIDSLINSTALDHHLRNHEARTTDNAHGRALSESIVALWFDAIEANNLSPDMVTLEQPASHQEPDDALPDQRWHQALIKAANDALLTEADAPDAPVPRPDKVILARSQTMADELIWYQTHSQLWPLRLSPRDNLAMRKGELKAPQPQPLPEQQVLRPAMVLGDVGASALPLAIALALQWLTDSDETEKEMRSCLLLDTPGQHRHAMLIRRPLITDNASAVVEPEAGAADA